MIQAIRNLFRQHREPTFIRLRDGLIEPGQTLSVSGVRVFCDVSGRPVAVEVKTRR